MATLIARCDGCTHVHTVTYKHEFIDLALCDTCIYLFRMLQVSTAIVDMIAPEASGPVHYPIRRALPGHPQSRQGISPFPPRTAMHCIAICLQAPKRRLFPPLFEGHEKKQPERSGLCKPVQVIRNSTFHSPIVYITGRKNK